MINVFRQLKKRHTKKKDGRENKRQREKEKRIEILRDRNRQRGERKQRKMSGLPKGARPTRKAGATQTGQTGK